MQNLKINLKQTKATSAGDINSPILLVSFGVVRRFCLSICDLSSVFSLKMVTRGE